MAKTSWPNSVARLVRDFSEFTFVPGDTFRWSPSAATVFVAPIKDERDFLTLLHETGHALAGHRSFDHDITLLKLEREAWDIARQRLAPLFGLVVDDAAIESALDSYREWLHARSTCPDCHANGVQRDDSRYVCLACRTTWKVNDARHCQLRRYRIPAPT